MKTKGNENNGSGKTKRRTVDENFFNMAKAILKGGATGVECARYMGCSAGIVSKIKNCGSFAEYEEWNDKRAEAARKNPAEQQEAESKPQAESQAVEQKQTIMVQVNNYMLQEQKRTNELLTLISNKLAFIVDELTGVKTGA